MPTRTDIRDRLKEIIEDYTSGYFGSYPIVQLKDYDIAGLTKPANYPVVQILAHGEAYPESSIATSDREMRVFIDVLPWCNNANEQEECDKIFEEFPQIIFADPQLRGLAGNAVAIDARFEDATLRSMGTDVPSMKVRFSLIIVYRNQRPV